MTKNTKLVIVLLAVCVLIAVVPIILLGNSASFGGADDQAGAMISSLDANYEPWYSSPIEGLFANGEIPGELASLFFCLQAAIGSGIFFFILGRFTMRAKMEKALAKADLEKLS